MARRFGGKYSPGAAPGDGPPAQAVQEAIVETRRVDAAGARANLLFVPAVIAAVTGIAGGPEVLVLSLGAAAVLGLGAWLLRDGLRAEAAYDARPAARRPALPRKILAGVLAGGGAMLAALSGGTDLPGSVLYGVVALALHLVAFGIDPMRDKRVEGIDTFQQDRVARLVDEAEGYLATIRDRIAALGDRGLATRVAGFEALARRMIRTVEEDPRDLTAARKYLGVYLMGARDATVQFADLYARTRDARARTDYEALLGDLETNYAQRTARLLEGGRESMDLEIKVLRDRLQREGVTPE
ncbi:5-bromo-4-chloroindolyl phosphate hydrolysis family protein [Rubellimicrobium arenae]|uniref:5-bromo-4-chloroindolyl phosphate hydrolysis family protein n=1 Tax=Rubellimicrobium arenae TaxID=2817372 RepID=UPI001B3044AC|nr:5-bromo-4-chloroindolyl phosphate hydrolysis family protein [Rubellimicrobium arenae]